MRSIKVIFVLGFGLLLGACGKYHGAYGGKYYMQDARVVHPIIVPKGINSPVQEQYYTVPNIAEGRAAPKLSLLPPDPMFVEYLAQYQHKKAHEHHGR